MEAAVYFHYSKLNNLYVVTIDHDPGMLINRPLLFDFDADPKYIYPDFNF